MNKKSKVKKKEEVVIDKSYSDMSENEMNDLLVELYTMPHWQAIRRFSSVRCILAETSLCSIDPFKYPTEMARNQGIRIGLTDLDKHVNDKIEDIKNREGEQEVII